MTIFRRLITLAGCFAVLGAGPAARAADNAVQAGDGNAVLTEKEGRLSGTFTYQLVVGQFYEWNTDPTAVPGILAEMAGRTGIKATVQFKSVGLDDPQMFRNPVLIMTGNRIFKLSKEEIANLRRYLKQGGFLYADDCGGADWSFQRMIKELVPGAEMQPLAPDHPIFKEFYPVKSVPKVVDLYGGPAKAFGIVQDGRLVVVYTHDTDLPCAWEQYPDGTYVHVIEKGKREAALRFGVNVILHALRQDLGKPATPADKNTAPVLPAPTPLPAGTVSPYPMRRQLPSTHITAIAPGKDHVWFGGFSVMPGDDEGMARYDKRTRRWQVITDAEGILSEEINCLALRGDKVLVGSDTWKWTKGMATFDPATNRWSTLSSENGLPHDRVVSIVADEKRTWIGCRQGIAVLKDGEEWATPLDSPVFPKGGPFMIKLLQGGRFVWANHFVGVACFDKRSEEWTALSKRTPLLPAHAIDMAFGGGAAWFLSPVNAQVKLVRFDLETENFSEFKVPVEVDLTKAFSLAAGESELVLGMRDNLGIYTISTLDGSLVRHWTLGAVPHDRTLIVGRLVFDDGAVWAALWPNGGLFRRAANTQDWREVPYRTGTPASHVLSLATIGNQLYVGTAGVGAWRYDSTLRTWFNLNLRLLRDGRPCNYIGDHDAVKWNNIYVTVSDGRRVWMGTNHGLIMHDPAKTPSGFEVLDLDGGIVKGLAVARGLVWRGGDDGKVRVYDPEARTWKAELAWTAPAALRSLCVWGDALWAATEKGLYSRPLDAGEWGLVAKNPDLVDLQGLWPTGSGLWIATRDSLYVLREAGHTALAIKQSPAWRPIHCVYPFRDGILVGTDHGLIACDSDGNSQALYNEKSGIATPAIAAIEADDRYVWLATLGGGLTRIDSSALGQLDKTSATPVAPKTP